MSDIAGSLTTRGLRGLRPGGAIGPRRAIELLRRYNSVVLVVAGCAAGCALGFLLVVRAGPFLLAMVSAMLAAAPAVVLYWLGTLHVRRQRAQAMVRASEEFGSVLKQTRTGDSADVGLVATRPGIWTRT